MKTKELKENLGRRVILRGAFPNADELREVVIIELSPSEKLVKIRSASGSEEWQDISEMTEKLEEALP